MFTISVYAKTYQKKFSAFYSEIWLERNLRAIFFMEVTLVFPVRSSVFWGGIIRFFMWVMAHSWEHYQKWVCTQLLPCAAHSSGNALDQGPYPKLRCLILSSFCCRWLCGSFLRSETLSSIHQGRLFVHEKGLSLVLRSETLPSIH